MRTKTATAAFRRKLESGPLLLRSKAFLRRLEIQERNDLVMLGSRGYGFWIVPDDLLGPESTCYLVGVGEDITFDLALIARYGCTAYAFDPTPASREYAAVAARYEPRFVFRPVGMWSSDTSLSFHAPAVAGNVSHSATDLHGTSAVFEADVRSVASLMRELGHERLDLLKVSAEGAEHEIVRNVLADDLNVPILCVEFAQPARPGAAEATCAELVGHGYAAVAAAVRPRSWKMTFVNTRSGSKEPRRSAR